MSAPNATRLLSRSVVKLSYPRRPFVCFRCRHRIALTDHLSRRAAESSTLAQQRGYSSTRDAITDRMRRKLWGTEDPPGQKDPYSKKESEEIRGTDSVTKHQPGQQQEVADTSQTRSLDVEPSDTEQDSLAIRKNNDTTYEEQNPYFVAPTPDQAAQEQGYTPATSLEQLEPIGGPTGWWEDAWDKENQFQAFTRTPKLMDPLRIETAVRTATYEIFTLHAAGLDLKPACKESATELVPSKKKARFRTDKNGTVSLVYKDVIDREVVLDALARNHSTGPTNRIPKRTTKKTTHGEFWKSISFPTIDVKFAIIRRIIQLTGLRIPDPSILSISTPGDLLSTLLVRSVLKKKLAHTLQKNERLQELGNISVRSHKYTGISKDIESGRWKRVQRELEEKGLPLMGDPKRVGTRGDDALR